MPREFNPGDSDFLRGVALYNARRFWDAHEAWETLWRRGRATEWADFIQGLIQVAAAFHKLFVQANPASAARILARGVHRLERYPCAFGGLQLEAFVDALRRSHASIEELRDGIAADPGLAPRLA